MTFIRPLSRLATNSLPIKNCSSLCYASCLIPGPSNGCLQLIRSYTNDCQEGTTIFSRKSIQETTSESIEEKVHQTIDLCEKKTFKAENDRYFFNLIQFKGNNEIKVHIVKLKKPDFSKSQMIITVPMARTLKNNIERNIFKKKLLKGEKYEKLQPQDVIFSKEISDGTETIKLDVLRTNGFTTVDGDLVVISNAYKKEDGERVSKIKLTTKYFKKFHKSLDEILGELKKLGIANSSMDLQESTLKNILNEEKSIEKKEEEL